MKHLLCTAALAAAALFSTTAQAVETYTLVNGSDLVFNFPGMDEPGSYTSSWLTNTPVLSGNLSTVVTWYAEADAGGSSQVLLTWAPGTVSANLPLPPQSAGFSLRMTATGDAGASLTVVPHIFVDESFWFAELSGTPGQLPTAPVPEPQTYALMLAGLAGIGFLARRRSAA